MMEVVKLADYVFQRKSPWGMLMGLIWSVRKEEVGYEFEVLA